MMSSSVSKPGKTICIAFPDREYYKTCMNDHAVFRKFLTDAYEQHPELFPEDFRPGFCCHSFVTSVKQNGFIMRRIRLKNGSRDVYQIRPSFMMPYMTAGTAEVEKPLYLRRWGVPAEALAYVFGRNAMFRYRAYTSPGYNSVVGTTVKNPAFLPEHVLADEKHTRDSGSKAYVATTVARGCILGAGLAANAGTGALTGAYRTFKDEAVNPDPDYQPGTVTTDGWEATQKAWKILFPAITVILCFLRSFLKIRDRCRRAGELLRIIGEKVWNAYHSETAAQFSQRIRRLREWAQSSLKSEAVTEKIPELCGKASRFKIALSEPGAYRTGNMPDRLMNYQDRVLYAMQYFHGTRFSSLLYLRSMSLIRNFHPYSARTLNKNPDHLSSPFEELNGFRYHDNWLENMLIAASMKGYRV